VVTTPQGDALRELVTVMDRLRSPGGCPWDAAQTHATLVPYAIEEAYEVAEAIEAGDRSGMREELGDLLLQVVFHARVAQEHPDDPFDLDDVARGIVTKLVRRHPHVFGAEAAPEAEAVHVRWEQIKQAEKQRESVLDGIPLALGALARSQKVVARTRRAGLDDALPVGAADAGAGTRHRGAVARARGRGRGRRRGCRDRPPGCVPTRRDRGASTRAVTLRQGLTRVDRAATEARRTRCAPGPRSRRPSRRSALR
jgi:XTP/dITP diphosphohydrolase